MANKPIGKQDSEENKLLIENEKELPLLKRNFILMAIAGVMIVLGFCLMAGGATDTESFNPDIFSTRRIVVGPTISFLGFIFMGLLSCIVPRKIKKIEIF